MRTSFVIFRVLGALAVATVTLDAQDPAPVDVHELARRFRTAAPTRDARDAIATAMLGEGERGAAPLFNAVRIELATRTKDLRKDVASYLRDFSRAAPRVVQQRLGREGVRAVDTLRDEVLRRSRGPDLTKELIHDELDPRMEELAHWLTIDAAGVRDAMPKLAARHATLVAESDAIVVLFGYREAAETVLLRSDSGRALLDSFTLADDPRGVLDELTTGEARAARLATPMSTHDAKVLESNSDLAAALDPGEAEGVRALNDIRLLLGLGALAIDPKLCDAARGHSVDMVRLGFFSHTSPVEGKESFGQRAALAGTSASAENIAAGQGTGVGAIRAWWYSPGHHRNMLSGAGRVGLGREQATWTQMFGA